jgi:hypothetical protein
MIIQEHQLIELFDQRDGAIAMHAFWILHKAIIPRINNRTLTAFPSKKKISQDSGLSGNTIQKALEYLEQKKIIKIERQYDPKTKINKVNIYSIDTDLLKTVGNLKSAPSQPEAEGGVGHDVTHGGSPGEGGVGHDVSTNLQDNINLYMNFNFLNFIQEKIKSQEIQDLYLKFIQKQKDKSKNRIEKDLDELNKIFLVNQSIQDITKFLEVVLSKGWSILDADKYRLSSNTSKQSCNLNYNTKKEYKDIDYSTSSDARLCVQNSDYGTGEGQLVQISNKTREETKNMSIKDIKEYYKKKIIKNRIIGTFQPY